MMIVAVLGSAAFGMAALEGLIGHSEVLGDGDDDDEGPSLIKSIGSTKVNLQQGLTASEQEGEPISGKFEV
jgi:hypothetical protein